MTSEEAKERLIAGNGRYVSGRPGVKDVGGARRRELSDNGQHPFALVVCCSDSRVPPELVFDQGLGDLFVVRTAGHTVDDAVLGSIEYGAEHLGIPLIVVLGHEKCGAVKAAVDSAKTGAHVHGRVGFITDKIQKTLERADDAADIYETCADENIRSVVAEIGGSEIVGGLIREGKTKIVGAKCGISSGKVTFF